MLQPAQYYTPAGQYARMRYSKFVFRSPPISDQNLIEKVDAERL